MIKALGLALGLTLWGPSLTEMLKLIGQRIDVPPKILDHARLLDLYYIPLVIRTVSLSSAPAAALRSGPPPSASGQQNGTTPLVKP